MTTNEIAAAERVFFVFDVESVGLHGEGYAYGYVVVDSKGNELASGREAVDPADVNGTTDGREWLKENCPSIAVTKRNLAALHSQFVVDWIHWKVRGAVMVADCPWPVEARFLIACELGFDGPYPLIDVGSVVLATGGNPIGEFDRMPSELPKHDPLCDARQSARVLIEHLNRSASLIAERDETTLRNTQRELLVDFVEECASDILNRVSPGCKARAKDILSALNIANPAGGA